MDLSPFRLDIDELVIDFEKAGFRSFSDMKRVWLARNFSYIYDAKPGSGHLALFMQSLYVHCVGHMDTIHSFSHRLGGLYCLYSLYEIQPIKPRFKIYISLGDLRRLKLLALDAKKEGIEVVSSITRKMLEKNAFLFGFVDPDDCSEVERSKINKHKAMLRKMTEKLFPDNSIDDYLHIDMGVELDLKALENISSEYAEAKANAVKELAELVDVQDIEHLTGDTSSVADKVEKIVAEWNLQKDAFYQQTRSYKHTSENLDRGNEDPGDRRTPVQELANEDWLGDDSLPDAGFMKMLTADDEELYGGQDIAVDEIERLLALHNDNDNEEELAYADDLEKLLGGD